MTYDDFLHKAKESLEDYYARVLSIDEYPYVLYQSVDAYERMVAEVQPTIKNPRLGKYFYFGDAITWGDSNDPKCTHIKAESLSTYLLLHGHLWAFEEASDAMTFKLKWC